MPYLDRALATLRIVGDDLVPDEVSRLLGTNPSRSQQRGDEIPSRFGRPRVARFGLWLLEAAETEPADVEAQVDELLSAVTSDLDVWQELSRRFDLEMFCGWFMAAGNEAVFIEARTLGALAERHIALDLDIYEGGDLNWFTRARSRVTLPLRRRHSLAKAARTSGP